MLSGLLVPISLAAAAAAAAESPFPEWRESEERKEPIRRYEEGPDDAKPLFYTWIKKHGLFTIELNWGYVCLCHFRDKLCVRFNDFKF